MAKRRIHIDLIVDSEATADTLIAQVQLELQNVKYDFFTKDIDILKSKIDQPTGDGLWHVVSQLRFNVDTNTTDLKQFVEDKLNDVLLGTKILSGSKISIHTCTHEELEQNWQSCIEDIIVVK